MNEKIANLQSQIAEARIVRSVLLGITSNSTIVNVALKPAIAEIEKTILQLSVLLRVEHDTIRNQQH